MSSSIRRRNSNKQGLQNLIRVTAQRSQEDAEELERERRRRSRDKHRELGAHGDPGGRPSWTPSPNPPQDNRLPALGPQYDEEVKASCGLVLEEDEGFSDWTQRLENRKETLLRQENGRTCEESRFTQKQKFKHWVEAEKEEDEEEVEEEDRSGPRGSNPTSGNSRYVEEKIYDRKKNIVILCSSAVLAPKEARSLDSKDQLQKTSSESETERPCSSSQRDLVDGEEVGSFFQGPRRRMEESYQRHGDREEWGVVEVRGREEKQDRVDLHYSLDERCRVHDVEVEHSRPSQEVEKLMSTQERECHGEVDDQRMQTHLINPEEVLLNPYGPMGPTFKMTERKEPFTCSLNTSTSSTRRTPVALSKIDNMVEHYTHAAQGDTKTTKAMPTDLVSPTEPVASKKNLFEGGEAWSQNSVKAPPSKDAEGLKVGVADLINQWVKGSPDGTGSSSPTKPAEIRPGDVLSKKNLWENLGDSLSSGRGGKGSPSGKRYRFVVTGHGKYEKVAVVDDGYSEYEHYQSAGHFHEDL